MASRRGGRLIRAGASWVIAALLAAPGIALADRLEAAPARQTGIQPNYSLAARFMPAEMRQLLFDTSLTPHWFTHSDRFWFSYKTTHGTDYFLVDPDTRTRKPLWDNAKVAAQLSLLTVAASDDARYFVVTCSRVDTAPVSVLVNDRGDELAKLAQTDVSRLLAAGYQYPKPFTVKAADGITDLYGVMYAPFDMHPGHRYPVIDPGKVGIWGHSGGGFMTAAAMLQYPTFYTAGWGESGNHDNNNYNREWSERYDGVREEEEANGAIRFVYTIEKNESLAANLRGHLMLTTGDMDDNVNLANTMQLASALMHADKRFEMLVFPGMRHPYTPLASYVLVRRMDFFARWLLGASDTDPDILPLQNEKQHSTGDEFTE